MGPIFFLTFKALSLSQEDGETWFFILSHLLPGVALNTLSLLVLVVVGTLLLGVFQAFVVIYTNLPWKQLFHGLFILPLSFPLYVMAFIYVGMFEFHTLINVKSVWGVAFVFIITLSPYVYLLARNAFQSAGLKIIIPCRSLGYSPIKTFFKGVIPYSRPWLFTGGSLVAMETLADFGGVGVFNYDTLTTAIYSAWTSLFSLSTAARLSLILMAIALSFSWFESVAFKKGRFFSSANRGENLVLFSLSSGRRGLLFVVCWSIVFFTLALPLWQLAHWGWGHLAIMDGMERVLGY